ncbi:SDR family NAD(P)-dependent oxidoreductase [Azotobacter beijerinckii]|uniref:SDR family NAD(P)-dependent oxidoreductase n=1 Tax=Azotobacter beijerinckii TaxID=170623 RepID=UPI00295474F8|nr:SDR family NAD(P)-dependent oxidoreductase [Azotobacter beijerinckii]MDV7211231.1 SDR family NAD(P)-dependent oxidoreductase [Azotobacter beijerinckii]
MARIFITGSADGLGRAAVQTLLAEGHQVVVHLRARNRRAAVQDLVDQGAAVTIGDLADLQQTLDLARQVNDLGVMDAVIHNAGVYTGPHIFPVNIVAPYLLTALIQRPKRLIYLSSSMHRSGRAVLDDMDWSGKSCTSPYTDSKLFVTTLAAAAARLWPDVLTNSVDPGWVPTRMGGPDATDDLRLGHLTQVWLATSDDAEACTSGGYWHHQKRMEPHPAVHSGDFQANLLDALARATGTSLLQSMDMRARLVVDDIDARCASNSPASPS